MATRLADNLPTALTSFLDRAQDVREVRDLIGRSRLVSLIGPGGVGKSRLALEVAARSKRSFRDGCWLIELASAGDPSLLAEVVAGALRVPERSGRDSLTALAAYVAHRELLMVLDNCEQLSDACATLLATTLPQAPGLRVLATSQEVLGLPGETVYRLRPLVIPDRGATAETAESSPAVALYADRAASALHGFALTGENVDAVTELCRRLEGMPLAIELAAGHARVMSPAQVLERMGERLDLPASRSGAVPIRQQSLQAAVQWSYDLCSQAEQVLWARLSVFAGSFDLAAAEAVCTGTGSADVAETVSALVDKSVLISEPHATGMRYRLLETIRQYGSHKLRESQDRQNGASEELLRSRHLGWYSGQAAQFDRSWFGPGQRSWVERLRVELPNIRAALSFAVKHSAHADRGLRLAGDLCIFWRMGALREGEQWLTRLLQADAEPTVGRARAQVALAWLLAARGQPQAISVADEALSTAERVEPSLVPRAMCIRSSAMAGQDLEGTMKVLHTALAEAKRIGSGSDMALAMHDLGWSLGVAGRVAEADSYFDDSLALTEEAGELWLRGAMQFRRALVGWMHGDLERMTLAATDALRAARVVNDPFTCANAASLIGVAAVGSNDRLAATLFGAAERFWEDAGGSIVTTPPWQGLLDDAKARCLGGTGAAGFDEQYRRGRQHPLEDAITAALDEPPQRPSIPLAQHDFGLTRRELEVVELVSQGLTNKEIATRLVISSRTAETHVQNALTKTGFNSRSQLAAWRAAQVQGRRESGPRTAGQ